MATAARKAKKQTAREALAIETATGPAANPLWEELAEEAERYARLVQRLKHLPADDPRRAELEGELYAALSHLAVHARLLLKKADAALK